MKKEQIQNLGLESERKKNIYFTPLFKENELYNPSLYLAL